MANCPECEALLDIDDDEVEEGDVISCVECGTELEVVSVHPIEVERLEDEDEEEEDEEGATFAEDEDDDDDDTEDDEEEH